MTYLSSLGTVVTESFYVLPIDRLIHNRGFSFGDGVAFFGGRRISRLARLDLFPTNLRVLDFDTVH